MMPRLRSLLFFFFSQLTLKLKSECLKFKIWYLKFEILIGLFVHILFLVFFGFKNRKFFENAIGLVFSIFYFLEIWELSLKKWEQVQVVFISICDKTQKTSYPFWWLTWNVFETFFLLPTSLSAFCTWAADCNSCVELKHREQWL